MIGLKYIRTTFGDTTTSLAEKLGISNVNISNWENGKKSIPDKRADEIAKLYNVPVEYLSREITYPEQLIIKQIINWDVEDEDIHREKVIDKIRTITIANPEIIYFLENLIECL